jgi:hypothetical protein
MTYYVTTVMSTTLVFSKVWLNTMIHTILTLYIIINYEGLGYLPIPESSKCETIRSASSQSSVLQYLL